MCRYASFGMPYRTSFACIECRHVAQFHEGLNPRCPKCRQPMLLMGWDFQAPKKSDNAGWAGVRAAIAENPGKPPYISCGCNGPGPRPRTGAVAKRREGERRSDREIRNRWRKGKTSGLV